MGIENPKMQEKKVESLTAEQVRLNIETALNNALEYINAMEGTRYTDNPHGEHIQEDLLKMINDEALVALDAKRKFEAIDNVFNG
jgi:hypothetical protein